MTTIIRNARIVTPGAEISQGALRIEDGLITAVAAGNPGWTGDSVIDAENAMLTPGFIDVHCHGRNNCDFSDGSADGVATIARGKLEEGVTTLLPTTLTLSHEQLAAALESIRAYDQSAVRIPGVHLEGPFVNVKFAGAQNPAYVRLPDPAEVESLRAIFPVRKITAAIELEGALELIAAAERRGIVVSCTHSGATYARFLEAYAAGLRNLSHFCNQMSPLHHRDIGLVGAGLLHRDVYAELICDKLHISPPMIQLVFQTKGADRVILITDAMRAAGMPDGDYTLGGLPVVVKEGAARLREGGALAGSTLQLATAFRNVCEVTGLPRCEVVKSTSLAAANSLGLAGLGRVAPGYFADLVLLDDDFGVLWTMVGGEIRYRRG